MIIPMLCVNIFVILVVWFLLPRVARLMIHTPTAISIFVCLSMVQLMAVFISMRCTLCGHCLQVTWALIFFFFQAEDGIRDYKVTGVQTCALPIFHQDPITRFDQTLLDWLRGHAGPGGLSIARAISALGSAYVMIGLALSVGSLLAIRRRSEERRVGKECRSRWSPYH